MCFCMCVHEFVWSTYVQEALETVRSPETGVMGSCEPTLGHMQEQLSLLTAELSLQPHIYLFLYVQVFFLCVCL